MFSDPDLNMGLLGAHTHAQEQGHEFLLAKFCMSCWTETISLCSLLPIKHRAARQTYLVHMQCLAAQGA